MSQDNEFENLSEELLEARRDVTRMFVRMILAIAILIVTALFVHHALAGPYILDQVETSCSPGWRNCEIQNRIELGYSPDRWRGWDFYLYHESDPRNGFEGNGWPRETENGNGVRFRYEW